MFSFADMAFASFTNSAISVSASVNPVTGTAVTDTLSSAALGAGSSVDLDGTAISVASTGKLLGVEVSSTVGCKWEIKTRDGAVLVVIAVFNTAHPTLSRTITLPSSDFATLGYGNGDENFRVTVTNLDQNNSADVYATIYWDEV